MELRSSQRQASVKRSPSVSPRNDLKRKLPEDDESPEMPPQKVQREFKKHDVHWIPEGNVLLEIGGVRFKLVRSRLASQSVWFKNLFDAHANGIPDPPPEVFDTDEIQKVLANSEYSDGLPLFFLDQDDEFPSHEEFAALLTAMDNAIAYMYQRPTFPVLSNIFCATTFYRCDLYETQVKKAILDLYPDNPKQIEEHNKAFLVDADLKDILPSVFYQLSRIACDETEPVESLTGFNLLVIITLQRRLASSWDNILESFTINCPSTRAKCADAQVAVMNAATALRTSHLFDPIFAINKFLLKKDETCKSLCSACNKSLMDSLRKARTDIWQVVRDLIPEED
ncbi:hypothetical protein CPC08DRAFT_714446 [Agrocybe pediades]|nr:hypothetical protein CPC08DRAFT_714446 [Agrocybe pediades]